MVVDVVGVREPFSGPRTNRRSGGGGIRTRETSKTPTSFQDWRLQPDSATPPATYECRPLRSVRDPVSAHLRSDAEAPDCRTAARQLDCCSVLAGWVSQLEASPSLVYGAGLLIPLGQLAPRGFESLSLRSKPQVSGLLSDTRHKRQPTCPIVLNVILNVIGWAPGGRLHLRRSRCAPTAAASAEQCDR